MATDNMAMSSKATSSLGFTNLYLPAPQPEQALTLLLLHGTGGDENDLLALGRLVAPDANLLGVRGKVLEHGAPRFFRRLAEGVFDLEDLRLRTEELADFVASAATAYGFDRRRVFAVGYSNGANIAGSLLLRRPGLLAGAVLLRAMVPFIPEVLPDLAGVPVLLVAGRHDPIVSSQETEQLAALLRDAQADVTLVFQESGHGLTQADVDATGRWLRTVEAAFSKEG